MAGCEDRPAADLTVWEAPTYFTGEGMTLPGAPCTPEIINKIKAGDVPEFDIMVATYPRSGTSRLVEICWMLTHGCNTDNVDALLPQSDRRMFIEFMAEANSPVLQKPSLLKTHLGFKSVQKLVERKSKIIVGMRNPKDALVSYYHFNRMTSTFGFFPGNWHQFMELYRKDQIPWGDFFDFSLGWWAEKDRDNTMIVMYEDLNENPLETVTAISKFLGEEHSEEKLKAVVDWTSFSNMRIQPSTNFNTDKDLRSDISTYMRKGTVGDWKNYFSAEESQYIDNLYETRCAPVGLKFRFE